MKYNDIYDGGEGGDCDGDGDDDNYKISKNHALQNQNQIHEVHSCHRHKLVYENRSQRFLLLTPRVMLDNNHSSSSSISSSIGHNHCTCNNDNDNARVILDNNHSSSSSICISDNQCTCNNDNNNDNITSRNTNSTTSKRKLTARMEEHRLSRWDSSSSLVPTITQTLCPLEIHDIPPITTSDKIDCMNSRISSHYPIMSLKPPKQRESSDDDIPPITTSDRFDCVNSLISQYSNMSLKPPQRRTSADSELLQSSIASVSRFEYFSPISKAA